MRLSVFLVVVTLLSGCNASTPEPTDAASSQPAPQAKPPAATASAPPVAMPRTPAPDGGRVYIVEPADGATVTSPVHVVFGAANVTIVPAGDKRPNSGHHHLIIDADLPDPTMPIPANENYKHFGDGSTSTRIELEPGEHRLMLLLGDASHVPHETPIYSQVVTITVSP